MFANINHKYFRYTSISNNIYPSIYMYVKNTHIYVTQGSLIIVLVVNYNEII